MPAITECQSNYSSLTHRDRRQAGSYKGYAARLLIARRSATNHFTSSCGSIGFTSCMVRSLESQTLQP